MGTTCSCLQPSNQVTENKAIPVDTNSKIEPEPLSRNPTADLTSTTHVTPLANSTQQCLLKPKNSGNKLRQQRNSAFLNRTIIFVGVYGYFQSGKKSFIKRIIEGKFEANAPADLSKIRKKIPFNGKTYEIDFFLCPFSQTLTKTVDFHLVLYDINNEESLQTAKNMINRELHPKVVFYEKKEFKSNLFLIGNKSDEVTAYIKGEEYCRKNNYRYYEISVKANVKVEDIINDVLNIFDCNTFQA